MSEYNNFIYIDYDENDPRSYRGVYVTNSNGNELFRSNTGNPEHDWRKMVEYYIKNPKSQHIFYSSSVTHFLFDVPGWKMDSEDMLIPYKSNVIPFIKR